MHLISLYVLTKKTDKKNVFQADAVDKIVESGGRETNVRNQEGEVNTSFLLILWW